MHELIERMRHVVRPFEADPGVADELGMAAASPVEGRKAACERLEQRVRARVVEARGDVAVLAAKELRELVGGQGLLEAPPGEAGRRAAHEGQLTRSGSTDTPSDLSTSPPFRGLSDQLVATTRTGRPSAGSRLAGGWKTRGRVRS